MLISIFVDCFILMFQYRVQCNVSVQFLQKQEATFGSFARSDRVRKGSEATLELSMTPSTTTQYTINTDNFASNIQFFSFLKKI